MTTRFVDRFDSNRNQWPLGESGAFVTGIAGGELTVTNTEESGTIHWLWTGPALRDGVASVKLRFELESDVEFLDTAGLLIRHHRDRFLCLGVNSARGLVVGERRAGGADRWRARTLETSPAVRPGRDGNLLELTARGTRVECRVNGERVHVIEHTPIEGPGQVGLFAVSPTRVRFDDLVVRDLPDDAGTGAGVDATTAGEPGTAPDDPDPSR